MYVSAQSQRLPIKLGEKYPPTLIENGTVETSFLCNATTWLLNSSLRRGRHVFDLQVLSENLCVVLADFQRDLFDEITTDIGDMLMKPCNRCLLFTPILSELLHSCIHASFLSALQGSKNVPSESVQKRTHPMSMPTLSPACLGGSISYSVWMETCHPSACRETVTFLALP